MGEDGLQNQEEFNTITTLKRLNTLCDHFSMTSVSVLTRSMLA